MEGKIVCKCGKIAIGFTTDSSWICSDCLDERIKEAKKRRTGFMIKKTSINMLNTKLIQLH